MDLSWLKSLSPEMRELLIGSGGNFAGGVTASVTLKFIDAIGRKAGKWFQTDERQKALNIAMARALYSTSQSIAPDEGTRFHFIKVFTAWLERESVATELGQLIDPGESSELDMAILQKEFNAVGFPAERLQRDIDFSKAVGCFTRQFRNAAADQPELQERIKIDLLDRMVHQFDHVIGETQKQTRTLERIERHVAPPDKTERLREYFNRLARQHEFLPLTGLDFKAADADRCTDQRMPLDGVYIQMDTTARRQQKRAKGKGQQLELFDHDGTPITVLEALIEQGTIVLLGDPGGGKSTFVNHLSYCLAMHHLHPQGGWLDRLPQWPEKWAGMIPVPVVLRELAAWLKATRSDQEKSALYMAYLKHWLTQIDLDDLFDLLRDKIKSGEAMLLLDGLDEVPDDPNSRKRIIGMIDDLTNITAPKLTTCRVLSYQDDRWKLKSERWRVFDLDKLSDPKIDAFIGAWFTQLAQRGACIDPGKKKDKLRTAVRRPDLIDLARNPLLLTVMAIVHAHKGELPDSRAELYEDVIELLMDRWEAKKNETRENGQSGLRCLLEAAGLRTIDLRNALWEIAYDAHAQTEVEEGKRRTADIAEAQLLKSLRKLHPDKSLDWADAILRIIKLRAGLLLEIGPGIYSFPHRTFQEYLAGCHLTTAQDFTAKAKELAKQGAFWWDVILMAAGRLIHLGQAERPLILVSELLGEKIPEDEDIGAWRNVVLASRLLAEIGIERVKRYAVGPNVAEKMRDQLVHLIARGLLAPRERAMAADSLAVLNDPRPGVGVRNWLPDMEWLPIEKGPFIMGSDPGLGEMTDKEEAPQFTCTLINADFEISRYPVTVAQYRAFIDDGGYERERFWTDAGWPPRKQMDIQKREKYEEVFQLDNHPQVGVSWYEAVAFCNWLSEKTGHIINLPTEAQWERSARHTDGRIYTWGNEFEQGRCNTREAELGSTSAVGVFPL